MCLALRIKRIAALAALVAAVPATAGVIDFDGTDAPGLFANTVALSDYYAPLGLSFSGASAMGGVILNQAAEFGFMARSGTDFLALDIEAGTGSDERIAFASAQDMVSIHAATYEAGTFSMTAFDGAGNVLAFVSQAATREWQALTLNHAGIRSVVVASTTAGWAMDDLSFAAAAAAEVPEPGALALLGAGMLGFAALRRKQ